MKTTRKVAQPRSAIERVVEALGKGVAAAEVLVPEGCAEVTMNTGHVFHITAQNTGVEEGRFNEYHDADEYAYAVEHWGFKLVPKVEDGACYLYAASGPKNIYRHGIGAVLPDDDSTGEKGGFYAVLFSCADDFADYMADGTFWEPDGTPTGNVHGDWLTLEDASAKEPWPQVELYPLTQAQLHAAEENAGYGEHCQMHGLVCTQVWVDNKGPAALYEFWQADSEGDPEWCKLWVRVRDGKLHAEY
jgi:hypothetical protein